MVSAVGFIGVNLGQHFDELLFRVVDVPQQLIVEVKDAGAVAVGVSPVVHGDVGVQLVLDGLDSHGPSDGFRHPRPRVHLDGGELNQRHQDEQQAAPTC